MFSPRIPMKSLAILCRSLSTMLGSGVPIHRALDTAAEKTPGQKARQGLREIADAVRRGEDITTAMKAQGERFPRLMIEMVSVAEETGNLPEILGSLAEHFENNQRLRKNFLMAITWPMLQLVAAVLVIALLILILGWIAQARGGEPVDVLGWGLRGTSGAIYWLGLNIGAAVMLIVGFQLLRRSLLGREVMDSFLMRIPILGGCMRAFGIARFSWAYFLTQQTGMPLRQSISSSLRATGNGAFIAQTDTICSAVMSGEPLAEAFAASQLFPAEYIEMVHVAETSGTVPEMLERLSPDFENQARRSLEALVAALGWVVWAIVACFIIFVIFSIVSWYTGLLNEAMQGI